MEKKTVTIVKEHHKSSDGNDHCQYAINIGDDFIQEITEDMLNVVHEKTGEFLSIPTDKEKPSEILAPKTKTEKGMHLRILKFITGIVDAYTPSWEDYADHLAKEYEVKVDAKNIIGSPEIFNTEAGQRLYDAIMGLNISVLKTIKKRVQDKSIFKYEKR